MPCVPHMQHRYNRPKRNTAMATDNDRIDGIDRKRRQIVLGAAGTAAVLPPTWLSTIHVGHSTGGGEVVRYLARHGESRASKAVLIAAVPPLMVKSATNPGGLPKDVFDGIQQQVANNRPQFYRDLPATAFYGFNRPGVK